MEKERILNNMKERVRARYGRNSAVAIEFCKLVDCENKVFSAKIGSELKRLMGND